MKHALFFLCIVVPASLAIAGDHFSYRPKRLMYDFAVPFDDPGSPKLPPAKLTVTTAVNEDGHYHGTEYALLDSIEVELGKQRLVVPKRIFRDLGQFDLGTIDFYWVGRRYYISISRSPPDSNRPARGERIQFVFKEGALVDLWVGNKSLRNRYPKILDGTLEHPESAQSW